MRTELCESCRSRPAELGVCKVVGSRTHRERHLCARCAADSERVQCGDSGLLLTELLHTLIVESSFTEDGSNRTKVCPGCGSTLDGARDTGMLGCSMCYVVFREDIDSLITELHGYSPGKEKPG